MCERFEIEPLEMLETSESKAFKMRTVFHARQCVDFRLKLADLPVCF
jgi:hypothetical protein